MIKMIAITHLKTLENFFLPQVTTYNLGLDLRLHHIVGFERPSFSANR